METRFFSPVQSTKNIINKFYFNPIEADGSGQAEFSISTNHATEDANDVLKCSCDIMLEITYQSQKILEVTAHSETETIKSAFNESVSPSKLAEIAIFNTISLGYSFLRVTVETTTRSFGTMLPIPTVDIHALLEKNDEKVS